jgi:predicted ribosome quality control (RQC) complex YloA/Tae2 family protein
MQSFVEFKENITNIAALLEENSEKTATFIQQIFSTPHYIVLKLRSPGKNWFVYLGRGESYQGAKLFDRLPPSELRIRDRYLEYLRKHLRGARVESIELFENDKSVKIEYTLGRVQSVLILFWKGVKLYFAHGNNEFKFYSWKGKVVGNDLDIDSMKDELTTMGLGSLDHHDHDKRNENNSIESYLDYSRWEKSKKKINRKIKSLKRKVSKIEKDLKRLQGWRELWVQLEVDSLDLEGHAPLKKHGIKIRFDKEASYFNRKSQVFEKLKNFKRNESFVSERLQNSREELRGMQSQLTDDEQVDISKYKVIQPEWQSKGKNKKESHQKESTGIVSFVLNGSIKGYLGKTAIANDQIRKLYGSKRDLWLHCSFEKSPHVILKVDNITKLSPAELQAVGGMILSYMGLSRDEIEFIYSDVSGIKGKKGVPGMVIIKKPRYLRVELGQSDWKEIISMH